ncbi:MAG: NTPase [Candidatus Bathyarchaeota archaeon]|nr:NTPase [Candidatus Bathyarchaeota archaeon]
MTHIIFITGQPGIGKTSVLLKIIEVLKKRGYLVGGMISQEKREMGIRIGFEIIDISTAQRGWLARVAQSNGPRVGKYRVNLDDLKRIGASSILNAIDETDVIVIDEVGPMELFSPAFKQAVIQALKSNKTILGTIHHRAHDSLVNNIRSRKDAEILDVTYENRNTLHNLIIDKILQSLSERS